MEIQCEHLACKWLKLLLSSWKIQTLSLNQRWTETAAVASEHVPKDCYTNMKSESDSENYIHVSLKSGGNLLTHCSYNNTAISPHKTLIRSQVMKTYEDTKDLL